MSESGEVIIENLEVKFGSCSLDHETETPPNYKTKKFRVGEGNIIGKGVIQEFFDYTGSMPINKRSILLDTNCYEDAIVMLVEKLERKFVHIHPALQKVFYEFPNINHPLAKKIATIILMREFDFIIQEARDIFAFYKKDVEHPPIEYILHDKETMRSLESGDYESYSENLKRRVPYSDISQSLYLEAYEEFDWITRGIYVGFNRDWLDKMMKEPVRNEIRVLYNDIYGDDPDYGFMNVKITNQSPFHDLSSSTRREIKERIDLLRRVLEDLMRKELHTKYDNP
jgi:hypothetical protein